MFQPTASRPATTAISATPPSDSTAATWYRPITSNNSPEAIRQSNYMTNVLPQASNMNCGAWLQTEEIAECYRDIETVTVIGGAIWSDKPRTDFVTSCGVETPDAFWKVLIREDRAIAWIST